MLIDRYIAREINHTLLAIFGVLMIILVSHQFVRYLADAAAGEIPGEMLIMLIGLKTIGFSGLVLPLSLFLAVIIGLGRLYRDSEMIVMAACGISQLRVLAGVMRSAFIVGIILIVLSLFVIPWVAEQKYRIFDRIRAQPELIGIAAGRFQEAQQGNTVYFVEQINHQGKLENVFIQYQRPGGRRGILTAARGYQEIDTNTGQRFLILINGHRYEESPQEQEIRAMDYDRHGILIPIPRPEVAGRNREALSSMQLFTSRRREDQAELQWRGALPISAMLLAALGVPLSKSTPREGRYGKVFTAILLYVIFSNLLSVARNWMERDIIPVELGLWWVHGLLFLIVIMMNLRANNTRA